MDWHCIRVLLGIIESRRVFFVAQLEMRVIITCC